MSTEGRTLLPTATRAETWRAVRRSLGPHKVLGLLAIPLLVAETLAGLVGPAVLGHIVDLVVEGAEAAAIVAPVLVLLAAGVAEAVLGALGTVTLARVSGGALADLREQVVTRALGVPLSDLERAGTGDLVARVEGDVETVSEATDDTLGDFLGSLLDIVLTVGGLALLDWRLALAGLAALPVQFLVLRWYLRRAGPLYAAAAVAEGERAQALFDSISGAATVRAFRLSGRHLERISARSQEASRRNLKSVRALTGFISRLNVAELVGMVSVLTVGFLLVAEGEITVGAASAAALYFHRLFGPVNSALGVVDDIQQAGAALARLVGVASLRGDPRTGRHKAGPGPFPGARSAAAVHLVDVDHEYLPGHLVLSGVNLSVETGERVALVGPSGAGKSTLAKLIAGIHEPTRGRIQVAGFPLDQIGSPAAHGLVALITQEVHVFAGTLADDLRLARPDATKKELWAALDHVGARDWVKRLDKGINTLVGEGGARLTPAQAQHLALARLVLADPPVAVLDEATAEAGSAGARALEAAVDRALAGRTAVVVAHRLTQAAAADRVVVLDRGRIVETGSHEALVASGGCYATLWAAWSDPRRTRLAQEGETQAAALTEAAQ